MRRPFPPRLAAMLPPVLAAVFLAAGALPAQPPPTVGMAAAAGLLVGTGTLGLRLAGRLLPGAGVTSRTTAATLFALLLVILPVTLLGHFGLLERRFFLPVEALLALSALLLPPPGVRRAAEGDGASPARVAAPWERALLAAAFAAAAVYLGLALAEERHLPPQKGDDPSYHLSTVAVWHQHGDLRMPKFGFGDKSTPHYPVASEMLAWALLAPLEDSDYLARWMQLPVALASLAAVAAVALALGASPAWAAVALLLYLSVPLAFPVLALSAGNDHLLAFALLAAVDATLLLRRCPAAGGAVYAGAALGLAAGTKYLGVLFAPPVVLLLAVALLWPRPPLRRAAALMALAGAVALLAGGYTYARNAVATGNPVYPAPVEVAGLALPGWSEVTLDVRRHQPEFAIEPLAFLRDPVHMGRFLPWTGAPASLLAPLLALLLPGLPRRRLVTALVLALPATFFLQFLLQVHDHRSSRYLFAALALAAVAFAWLGDRAEARWPALARAGRGVLVLLVFVRCVRDDHLHWGVELALGALLL
ncbi:MAG TPA: hypothetical protein VHQ65_12395, partial [Thermoanaerobaculia bacterium]|nr:hypothetical protein [Thermoanaerobaculia bacterium]